MKKYIGTKIIDAEPMFKDGKEGYKVIYDNPNNTKYESWSPKDVFEKSYIELDINEQIVRNRLCDIFYEVNNESRIFIPQSYVWKFLDKCILNNISIIKED